MNDLTGKVAIVTGASKGIGAAIAKALASAGAAVAVNYASSRSGAERTVLEIVNNGGKAIAVQGDVGSSVDVKRLFQETKAAFGAPSILVNNAATFEFEPFERVTETEFHKEYNTNVLGPILTIQEAIKYFPEAGGSVINISSISSKNPVPTAVLYSSTKGAVDALSAGLAKELGPRNIRVNVVAPGGTETEGTERIGLVGSEQQRIMAAATPLGRFGRPEDIAPTVVFLASDDAAWLTGERINASGGLR
ncbi:glucose 1-dehydrogenase [Pseudomonas sp. RC10]|uniref:SDR family NAD(P)-dependent oxidoreductase n=1 Tax=Pseudomonas bambusae TaxID=3139142 RepID=UPI003138A632